MQRYSIYMNISAVIIKNTKKKNYLCNDAINCNYNYKV